MTTAHRRRSTALGRAARAAGAGAALIAACSDSYQPLHVLGSSLGTGGGTSASAGAGGGTGGDVVSFDAGQCPLTCSNDLQSVVDCEGRVQATCTPDQGC